ncbi:MAG: nuclear transport factor 2 family protein, partial [Mycobacteriales bacterium]
MTDDPVEVARGYFTALTERDGARLRALFADDAELVTPAGTVRGSGAIADFYAQTAFTVDDFLPQPGRFVAAGGDVAVEIELRLGGRTTRVADVFTVAAGRITRLAV